jgi:hypothetical protein
MADEALTDKEPTNTPEAVRLWQERVSLGKRASEDWANKSGANRFVDEYNGTFGITFNGSKGSIPVPAINEIFAFVQADVSHTYNRDPYISVNPKSGSVKGAKLWEVILNYWWRKLKTKEEVEPEIIDKDLVGFAFHKVGKEVESEGAGEELKITKDALYSARIEWKDVVWNFGAKKPPYDCLWMAQRIVKPLGYIKRKYPNAKNIKGVQNPEVDKSAYDSASFKDDISVGVLWEIWDAEKREILLIAEGLNDQWLSDPRPWPDYIEEFPFLMYWDTHAPGKQRPMSAIAPWETQVLEKMVILASAVNHAKRWNRQMVVKQGAISTEALDKFERGDDGAILENTGTGDLDKNVHVLDWGTLPVDFYLLLDRLSAIERDVNGQPEFERGGVTKTSTRTSGELEMIQAGAKGRADRKVDRFEGHLENIARHMMMHLKADFDFEETVKITGQPPEDILGILKDHLDPVTMTIKYKPEDIKGEYEVEIKSGSTLPLNRENKRMILDRIMQTLGTVSESGVSPLLRTIISEILDEYDMKSLKEAYAQEQQMMDQQAANQKQETDANEAKARTQAVKNVAQADKIGAEADNIRMEFGKTEEPQNDM